MNGCGYIPARISDVGNVNAELSSTLKSIDEGPQGNKNGLADFDEFVRLPRSDQRRYVDVVDRLCDGGTSPWRKFVGASGLGSVPVPVGIDGVPEPQAARKAFEAKFSKKLFPRVSEQVKARLAQQFPNWAQCMPDIRVARQDWSTLRQTLQTAGRELPLAVVTQISYGPGMGHPKIGLFRDGKFWGEPTNTYLYHATPGLVLRGGKGCTYHRLDHVPSKPSLYAFWILSYDLAQRGAEELHARWRALENTGNAPGDCGTFVTDFAKHMASLGDPNNPFTYDIKSCTIREGWPDDRGMRSILKSTHRPPAGLLFILDPARYDHISAIGHDDGQGWVVDCDAMELNVTSQ